MSSNNRQDTLKNLLIAGGIFLFVVSVAPRFFPPRPSPPGPADTRTGHSPPAALPRAGDEAAARADAPAPAAESEHRFAVLDGTDEPLVYLGSPADAEPDNDPYRMRLALSNVGASIESAAITDHAARVGSLERYQLLAPVDLPGGSPIRSLEVTAVNIDGMDVSLAGKRWQTVSRHTGGSAGKAGDASVEFSLVIADAGEPAIRLSREYRLSAQARESGLRDLSSELRLDNLSATPRNVVVTQVGGVGVPRAAPRMDDRAIDCAIAAGDGRIMAKRQSLARIGRNGSATELYKPADSSERLSWVATGNRYFTCTVAPLTDGGADNPPYVAAVSAVDLDGDPATDSDRIVRWSTLSQRIEPGGSVAFPEDIYIGEKGGASFKNVERYRNRNYYFQISQGFGMCTFAVLVELMIWLLNGLHSVIPDYGVAIMILVVIVRLSLHPITKKGQINMVRMQQKMGDLGPKQEELKKKYANDKAKLQQEMMKLYREQGVNPAGHFLGCLPMVVQMPIWVALYLSLSNNVLIRHEPLHFTWVHDLTAQDALIPFASPMTIPLLGWQISSFNLLPLLVSLFMYIQQKSQPKPKPNPNASEQQVAQQEMMQKMMPLMSLMMLVFFYKAPAGLNLYIMCSSLFGWIEQRRIRAHIKEREESGTLQKPPRESKPLCNSPGKTSFIQKLQKMAEEAHKAQPRKKPRKGRAR